MGIYKIENTKNQKKFQQIPDIVYQAIMKSHNTLNWYNNSNSLLIKKNILPEIITCTTKLSSKTDFMTFIIHELTKKKKQAIKIHPLKRDWKLS